MRSRCFLRIGVGEVHGVWHASHWIKSRPVWGTAQFVAIGDKPPQDLAVAIKSTLDEITPRHRLTSPRVTVALAAPHVHCAIMSFAKLPRSSADRSLLITQRFCREHKLDADTFSVVSSPLSKQQGAEKVLCCAVERAILDPIRQALAACGLYADEIAPEFMLKLKRVENHMFEAPAIALLIRSDCATFIIWDKDGIVAHVASIMAMNRSEEEFQRKLRARLLRYSAIVASPDAPTPLYLNGALPDVLTLAELQKNVGITPLPWPDDGVFEHFQHG